MFHQLLGNGSVLQVAVPPPISSLFSILFYFLGKIIIPKKNINFASVLSVCFSRKKLTSLPDILYQVGFLENIYIYTQSV